MTKQTGFKKLLFLAVTVLLLTVLFVTSVAALDVNDSVASDDDGVTMLWSGFASGGSGDAHTCVFDQCIVSEAAHKEGDVYYKSCTCGEASAADTFTGGTCGENLTWVLTEEGELVIEGTGAMTSYGSSSSVPWYSNRSYIKTVTIGDSVTSIGSYAFSNCTGLTSVTIGDSVATIGEYAFYGCSGLTSVTIGDGVTSIGRQAFYNCTGLTAVYIKDLAAWCEILFRSYDGANPLYYAKNLYLDGELVTDLVIPEGVTSIGDRAFYGCSGLTSVTIGDSVTSIGHEAFEYCYGLTSVHITDLAAWCEISFDLEGSNPLVYANNLYLDGELVTDLVIPEGVTSIGDRAFYGCSGLTSVTIGDSVTSIGAYAFYGCSGLTSVTIPDSVTSISYAAFYECDGLTSVHITDLAAWCEISFDLEGSSNPLAYANNLYINGELVTDLVIPEGVTSIGDYALYSCRGLTSVTIPDSVASIGDCAFYGCSGLTSVTIGDSVTSIGHEAFNLCSGLTAVYITDLAAWCEISFSSSDSNPLYYAGRLYLDGALVTDLVIPDSVTSIRSHAFYNCTGLTSVTIGNSVTSIGSSAFRNCSGLTSVTIPDSVTSIGNYAFYNCDGLTAITVLSTGAKVYNSANTFSDTATIYGFAGSTAEAYATKYSRTFVPLAADITSVFELEATYTPDAEKAGQYLPVTTFTRTDANTSSALAFLFVEGATGKLYVKSTEGVYLALYDEEGSALALGSEATDIAVVYDDNSGVARFYVDGVIPYVGDEMVLANLLPVHDAAFHTMVAVTDTFDTLDGVSLVDVYNINASGTADFVGFQVNTNDSSSIRLLAGVDMLYYGTVGFEVELYSAGNLQGTVESQASKVYTGVIANGNAVTADSQGYRYLTALSINGIDRTAYPYDTEVYFLVKTYTAVGGVKTYGEVKKIVISYDAASMTHVYALDDSYVTE